jgi:hypothetical protein
MKSAECEVRGAGVVKRRKNFRQCGSNAQNHSLLATRYSLPFPALVPFMALNFCGLKTCGRR